MSIAYATRSSKHLKQIELGLCFTRLTCVERIVDFKNRR